MRQFKLFLTLLTLMCFGIGQVWGDNYSYTFTYSEQGTGTGKTWNLTNCTDQTSYWQCPTGTNVTSSVATIPGIFSDKTITSDVTITINNATYGSGTNPSANTFKVYNSSACSSQVTASNNSTFASSSTYVNTVYTVTKANAANFSDDLAILITKPGKTIRLKSIKVEFSYTAAASCDHLTMSSVTATPGNGRIDLSWPVVTNASSYTVTCKKKSDNSTTGISVGSVSGSSPKTCAITGLTNGTEYTWSVMPVGDGSTYCAANTPATGDATPNVTRTITYYDKDGSHTTTLPDGTNIANALNALYGANGPTSCNTDDYEYFVGWNEGEISGTATSVTLLSTEVANATSESKSYYAVWSDTEPADYSTTYSSNVSGVSGVNVSIGGSTYAAKKLGSNGAGGSFTVTAPSGTTKLYLHAQGWNSKSATLTLSTNVGAISPNTAQSLTANSAISGNSTTFTLTTLTNDFFEYTLSNITSDATITIATQSERGVIWGVNAVASNGSAKYITTCCDPLGSINGSVSLTQLTSGDNKGKLQATWDEQDDTDGWASSGIVIKIYEDGNETPVVTSDALANNTTSFTAENFIPKKCTQYYATLTATHGNDASYCAGDLVSDASEKVTTAGYSVNVTGVTNVTPATAFPSTTCASGFSIASMTGATGYDLPSSITVTGASHTWNSSTGALTISSVTGDVTITIAGQKKECTPMDAVEVETPTVTYNGASLSWGSVDHATKYKVYIKTSADVVIESDENISTSSRTYTVSAELEHSTTYKYSIVAVSEDEDTYCSSTKNGTFTTEDYPTVKLYYSENEVLRVAAGTDQQILTDFTLPTTVNTVCTQKELVGWTTAANAEYSHDTDAPAGMMLPGAKWQIPTNEKCTLYAVYAMVTPEVVSWDATAITDLGASDVFVIVGNNGSNYAMTNDNGTSNPPAATSITITDGKLSNAPADNLKWNISGNATDGYIFYPNGSTTTWLYCTNTNNGVRVGTGDAKHFTINSGYLYETETKDSRYVGIYNSSDWRCYDNNGGNIANQTFTFYKKNVTPASTTKYATQCLAQVAKPSITGVTDGQTYEENKTVTITSATAGATIKYTTDGSDPASSATAVTMATGSSFTLSVNDEYTIRAYATKSDMIDSDEANEVTVTIDKPFTTIANFITAAPATAKKLVFSAESNAVVLGANSNRIYIQDPTGGIYLYKTSHGKTWTKGKKVVGTLTGSYELNSYTPRMNVTDFGETVATADGTIPDAVVIDGAIDADKYTANRNKLVTISSLYFQNESVADGGTINITLGDDTYNIYNAFNALTSHVLPLSTTACTVTGILGYYSSKYQLMPIDANCIVTGANAVLPSLTGEVGGEDEEHATEVASGEKIVLTAVSGYTTTYKIGTGSENDVTTSGTEVTISGSNNDVVVITVKSTREYYAEKSKVYYYKINESLTKYEITKLTASNGSFVVKNSDGSAITSSSAGATITLEASADDNYHFVSWAISNASTDADVTSSVSLSSSTNKDATFVMPAYGVKVSATFAEDAYATVTFVKGADAASGTVNSQKVYVGQNATMPANSFSYAGHSFAGWELNSTTYQPGETYLVTAAGDIEFAAKWREKDINKDGQWELVTNANQLNAGDYVVIAQNAQGVTESAQISTNTNKYLYGVETTFSGDDNEYITKTNLNNTTAVKYVLGGTSGAWTLTDDATGKLLKIGSSDNPSWVDNNGSTWNIVINNESNALIYPNGSENKRVLYNTSGGFRPYSSGTSASMLLPQLYKFYRSAFVVSYDANGGVGAPDSQRADPDNNQVTISSTVPTREGYDFAGWEDGDGNAKSGTITLTENTTLFAQWTPTPYNAAVESVDNITITATPEGESAIAEGSNANVPYGTEVTLSYSDVASSHIFNGWNVTKADDAETVVTVTSNTFTMPAYAVNIAASVDAKASVVLTVTYEANEGEGTMEGNPFEFTFEQEVTVADNPFTKANYTFRGWQDQDENVYKPGDKFNIEKNMTLTAIWRANGAMYTITGTSAVSSSTGVPEGSTATYSQTYSGTAGQMTADKSTTLTLTGYANKIIKKAIFSMKTNKNGGAGSIKMTIGANTVIDYSADDFGTWFGSNTDSYKDVEVTIPDVLVNTNENIVVTMSASANSMYVRSYTFDYANAEVYSGTTSIPAGEKEAIVVKDGGNVTISGDVTAESIIVEDGGKVTLSADVNADVFHIAASKTDGEANSSGQVIVNAKNLHISGEAYFDYTLDPSGTATYGYYAFCVPFPVNSSTGIYTTSDVKLDDGVDYVLYNYHGEIRATGNYGWKRFNGTLTPGVFYLISLYADANNECAHNTIRFKMEAQPEGYDCKGASATIQYNEYAQTSGNTNDAGWNGVGNPTVQYVKADVDDSENNTKYNNTLQVYNHTANAFGPATTGVNAFTVGSPFFMQAKTTDYMSFTDGNGAISSNILAPARVNAQTIERICVSFGNEVYTDRMYIAASEDALNSYELCRDLSKMSIGTARVAQISSYNYGLNLMVEYAPLTNNQATYQLNLFAPAAGTYSLSSQAIEGATLYVTYNGAIVWNLSLGDYEVDLARGTTTGYGLMLVAQPNQMPTGFDTSEGVGGDAVQKILLNGQLYILRDGHLFDAVGKEVK